MWMNIMCTFANVVCAARDLFRHAAVKKVAHRAALKEQSEAKQSKQNKAKHNKTNITTSLCSVHSTIILPLIVSFAGFYLYVTKDSANQQQELRSRIVSPIFTRNTAHKCLRFYLYMNGNNVGSINAYVVREGYTPPLTPTWSVNKSSGYVWEKAFMNITPQASNYRVIDDTFCFIIIIQ